MKVLLQALALALASTYFFLVTEAQTLLWSDEFESSSILPNPEVWSYDVGGGGWGNNELQIYTSTQDNVLVQDGLLKIIARSDNSSGTPVFTSARIKTEERVTFTYGTLEARIRIPDLDAGLWPAFWTHGTNYAQVGWPNSGEVDIGEWGQGLAIEEGVVNRRVVSAAHWDMFGQYATYARSYDAAADLNEGFHIYRLEWTPEKMITYVDGNWIWEMDIADDVCPSCDELHQPHFVLFNMAVGGGFTSGSTSSSSAGTSSSSSCASSSSAGSSSSGGCPARGPEDITAPFPAELLVDWVRLYDNGFTQVDVPTQSPTTNAPSKAPTLAPVIAPTPPPVSQAQETTAPTISTSAPRTPVPLIPVTPTTPVPVPVSPVNPSTPVPVPVSPVNPVSPGSGKGGKGGTGGSRSNRNPVTATSGKGKSKGKGGTASRLGVSGGTGKGKGKSNSRSGTSRIGTSGGKAKGKGKGRYSRSGQTATGGSDETSGTQVEAGATPAPTTNDRSPATTQTPANTGTGTDGFVPNDNDEQDDEPRTIVGPSSLVAEPRARSSAHGAGIKHHLLSTVLSSLASIGLIVIWNL